MYQSLATQSVPVNIFNGLNDLQILTCSSSCSVSSSSSSSSSSSNSQELLLTPSVYLWETDNEAEEVRRFSVVVLRMESQTFLDNCVEDFI